MKGLYDDDFVGYKIASTSEIDTALREAIVAIDANVLLNLYRFRAQTSSDLIKILQSLGDRLVIPHQALREFWRHRQRSQASPQAATSAAAEALKKQTRAMNDALSIWAKHVGVDADELSELTARVDGFAGTLQQELQEVLKGAGAASDGDPLLEQLEQLLAGRVTSALSPDVWEECIAEGRRRIAAEEPPGYKDAEKEDGDSPEGGAGDFLVWFQATRHATEQQRDLVLITSDEKEDWWWRQQAAFLGPRPELALEYHRLSGHRFYLLRPSDLLLRAAVLQVEVDEQSSADAGRAVEDEVEASAVVWTIHGFAALLERLDREAPVQAAALRIAAEDPDGRVSRDQVYELGGYSDDRMLRGFTTPYRRLTKVLQADGAIPEGVPPILVARYPDGVKASYFSVPTEVTAFVVDVDLAV